MTRFGNNDKIYICLSNAPVLLYQMRLHIMLIHLFRPPDERKNLIYAGLLLEDWDRKYAQKRLFIIQTLELIGVFMYVESYRSRQENSELLLPADRRTKIPALP